MNASVLQCDMHAIAGQLELQTDIRGDQLDHHAVVVLQVNGGAATGDGDPGARGSIVPGKVRELLQVIDDSGGRVTRRTDVDDRNASDREGVRGVLKLELTVTPGKTDAGRDAAAAQGYSSIGLGLGGNRSGRTRIT